jgi:hypothetical protein
MANQIVVSAGAKVRNLSGVLTATSGVVSSVPLGAANGVATLDSGGKVPVSQLPSSVVTYLGTWNAATNTPTLVNGTGDAGDMYLCNVAGTVNFGAGPVTFAVGDWVLYGSGTWQKSNGQNGTVTSVAVTESGDSLNITGSPITTSGTINIGFNGTNLQYVNGAGNLTTFPTLITSIGLSMPSAFSVANSPLTANGTIAVTGAGVASQYIRGDGTLADFPSSGGGGSSVSYYLNGGTSQGTIGGTTYYEMSKTAVIGTGVDFAKSGDGFIVAFLTDANDPAQLNIPAGNWNYEIYASMSANGGTPQMYAELYKYDGTTFTLISTSSNEIIYDGTALNLYTFAMAVPATSLTLTDRLAVKIYATNSGGKTTTIHTQDGHLCQVITTFSTGITALNGLTAQVQYFQTGTSGTDFNISSTTATHTFNIPDASATARGLITTGTQTIAGTKTFTDATKNNGGIFLQNGSSGSTTGYMNFGGTLNGFRFTNDLGISNSFTLPSATGYTFTFDAITGTIAMLEGTQTFSGVKTFTNNITVNSITIGKGAGTGTFNTAIGNSSLQSNTTGYGNTSIGNSALGNNTTGYFNAAIGANALLSNSTGTYNNALGTASLYNNTTGSYNTAVGQQSGTDNTTGSNNTYVGYLSGYGITTGSNNTIIGNFTGTAAMANNIILADGAGNVKYRYDGTNNNFYGNVNFSSTIGNGTYTYTLPNATGTLALTTDLGAYLPLAGGTLTGSLTLPSNTASGNPALYFNYGANAASRSWRLCNDVESYGDFKIQQSTTQTGSTYADILKFTPTGGALFVSSVQATLFSSIGASSGYQIYRRDTSAYAGIWYSAAGSVTLDLAGAAGTVLNFASTGVATFSSSVDMQGLSVSGASNKDISFQSASNTGYLTPYDDGLWLSVNRKTTNGAFANTSASAANIWLNGASGGSSIEFRTAAANNTAPTTRMSITSGGNVGIGTSSPSTKLHIKGALTIERSITGDVSTLSNEGGNFYISAASGYNTIFQDGSTERMRITSGGQLYINTSVGLFGTPAQVELNFNGAAVYGMNMRTTSGDQIPINFVNSGGSQVGYIYCNASSTSYVTSSDYRLKQDLKQYNGLDLISAIKTYDYEWKLDKTRAYGVLAHELQEIIPQAVIGEKDAKQMQGVDYSKIVPILIKSIQELEARIKQLENK